MFSLALLCQLGNESDITLNPLGIQRAVGYRSRNSATGLRPVNTVMEPTATGQLLKIAENEI